MGEDEEGTFAALKGIRDPTIKEHRGRIVKTHPEGLLVESPVSSMRCVVLSMSSARWLSAMPVWQLRRKRIEFRMDINVGDILIGDGDIFGDDVDSQRAWSRWPNRAASKSRCARSGTR